MSGIVAHHHDMRRRIAPATADIIDLLTEHDDIFNRQFAANAVVVKSSRRLRTTYVKASQIPAGRTPILLIGSHDQCLKWRSPVKTMAMPTALAASMTS